MINNPKFHFIVSNRIVAERFIHLLDSKNVSQHLSQKTGSQYRTLQIHLENDDMNYQMNIKQEIGGT